MNKTFLIFILFFNFYITNAQKQNNTPGSDFFVDVPTFIDLYKDSVIPITFYVHESDCFNCSNDLNYIDISLKPASSNNFDNPLVFDTMQWSNYMLLFSDYSIQNSALQSQSFLDSKPINDENHSILFTADTNWWIPVVPVVHITEHYFYFNFNIPYKVWSYYVNSDSVIDFHVYVSIDNDTDEEYWFRVFIRQNSIIRLPGWYRGDTHFHAIYTQNNAENGLPLHSSKVAAKMLGLDWITVTDHSCDFDNYGQSMVQNWQDLGNTIFNLNLSDSSFILIRGIEASIKNSQEKVVHSLVYPNPLQPFSLPYIFDGGGDMSSTVVSVDMMLDSLKKYDAFCYAAHPFSEGDALSVIVGGGVWNLGDSLSPFNGQQALSTGNVIWNDLNYNSDIYDNSDSLVFKDPILGLENLNLLNTLTCTDTDRDPWNVEQQNEPFGFIERLENDYMHSYYRFNQNMEAYSFLLRKGLKMKFQDPTVRHWKLYLSAGSDAHGSFNYSNTDFFYGGLNGSMEENYPGTFSTLVYTPQGMGQNGEHILQALKDGHCLLSEGPVVNMFLYNNNDTAIVGDDMIIQINELNTTKLKIQLYTNYYYGQNETLALYFYTKDSVYSYFPTITLPEMEIELSDLFTQFNIDTHSNQYFAIRAEWYCQKQFSTSEQPLYRRNQKRFIAATNPIWLKIDNTNAILSDVSLHHTIRVNPNPAHDKCTIYKCNENVKSLTLLDVLGRSYIPSYVVNGEKIEISVGSFNTGLYLIVLETEQSKYTTKLLIE